MLPQHPCTSATLPVLDRAAIQAQLGPPGAALVDEILGLWSADLDDRLGAISTAAGDRDAQGLAIAAHTLRGSSMYVGASRLADSCAEIERLINALGAWPVIDAAVAALKGHAADARAALSQYRSGGVISTDNPA